MNLKSGTRVVLTRPVERSGELLDRLHQLGATVISAPMIAIEPVNDEAIAEFDAEIMEYDLVVFTSANAVKRVLTPQVVADWPAHLQVAVVGPATAAAVAAAGIAPRVVSSGVTGVDLVQSLTGIVGQRVFLPRGDRSDFGVERLLEDADADVKSVVVYRTLDAAPAGEAMADLKRGMDACIFYSPSALRSFSALELDTAAVPFICVGPTTAAEAATLGHAKTFVARDTTVDAIIECLQQALAEERDRAD